MSAEEPDGSQPSKADTTASGPSSEPSSSLKKVRRRSWPKPSCFGCVRYCSEHDTHVCDCAQLPQVYVFMQVVASNPPPISRNWAAVVKQNTPNQDEPERPNPGSKERKSAPQTRTEPVKKVTAPQSPAPASKPGQVRVRPQATPPQKQQHAAISEKARSPTKEPEAPGQSSGESAVLEDASSAPAGPASDASPRASDREVQQAPREASTPDSKANTPRFLEVRSCLTILIGCCRF